MIEGRQKEQTLLVMYSPEHHTRAAKLLLQREVAAAHPRADRVGTAGVAAKWASVPVTVSGEQRMVIAVVYPCPEDEEEAAELGIAGLWQEGQEQADVVAPVWAPTPQIHGIQGAREEKRMQLRIVDRKPGPVPPKGADGSETARMAAIRKRQEAVTKEITVYGTERGGENQWEEVKAPALLSMPGSGGNTVEGIMYSVRLKTRYDEPVRRLQVSGYDQYLGFYIEAVPIGMRKPRKVGMGWEGGGGPAAGLEALGWHGCKGGLAKNHKDIYEWGFSICPARLQRKYNSKFKLDEPTEEVAKVNQPS